MTFSIKLFSKQKHKDEQLSRLNGMCFTRHGDMPKRSVLTAISTGYRAVTRIKAVSPRDMTLPMPASAVSQEPSGDIIFHHSFLH